MISVIVYGRNDAHGYNPHKRVVLSLNCMAEVLDSRDDEILFVDYNSPDDHPTFIEAVADLLTAKARRLIRVLRVRPDSHRRFRDRTHLGVLEPVARNVALRRSNPANRWILSTNSDMVFLPRHWRGSLSRLVAGLPDGFYHTPRFEVPETLWEAFDRKAPRRFLRQLPALARDLHLEEVVEVGPPHVFDAPGDFQLVLRRDLFDIDGFDESMMLGWHIDSNLPKRLTLLRGAVGSLADRVKAFHCDHTRQATLTHGRDRIENDWARYVDNITRPDLPEQRGGWGLPDDPVEDIRLNGDGASFYVRTLWALLPRRGPQRGGEVPPYHHLKTAATYNDLRYPAEHMLPYLADFLSSLPRAWSVGYFGCRERTFTLFEELWRRLGFTGALHDGRAAENQTAAVGADLLIFEFGFASEDAGDAPWPGMPWPDDDLERLSRVRMAFHALLADERRRLATGSTPRHVVAVNAVHNAFEALTQSHLSFVYAPYGTRIRQGYVLPGVRPAVADRRAVVNWLQRRLNRAMPPPQSEVTVLENWLRDLLDPMGPLPPALSPVQKAAAVPLLAFLDFPALKAVIPATDARIAVLRAALEAARPSRELTAILDAPLRDPRAGEDRPLSALASFTDWERADWRAWAERAFGGPDVYRGLRRGRWMWERVQFLYGLDRLGALGTDRRVRLLVCSPEPLTGLLSELVDGVAVVDIRRHQDGAAVSQEASAWPENWTRPVEVFRPSALTFDRDDGAGNVAEEPVDAVLLPHNAAFSAGVLGLPALLARAERGLKPGGVLAFSAETILNARGAESWLRRGWLQTGALEAALADHTGLMLAGPFDTGLDAMTLDRFAPAGGVEEGAVEPLVTRSGDTLHTTGLWFLTKRQETPAAGWRALCQCLLDGELPDGLLPVLTVTGGGRRREDGGVTAPAGAGAGHILSGPYLRLPAGLYRLELEAGASGGMDGDDALEIEAVAGPRQLAALRVSVADLSAGPVHLRFDLPAVFALGGAEEAGVEFRVTHFGTLNLHVRRLSLHCHGAVGLPMPSRALLPDLSLTDIAVRNADGTVRVAREQPARHALFGPYLRLPLGFYQLRVRGRADNVADPARVAVGVDAVVGGNHVLCAESFTVAQVAAGALVLPFRVPPALAIGGDREDGVEFRIAHTGNADLIIEAVDLLTPWEEG